MSRYFFDFIYSYVLELSKSSERLGLRLSRFKAGGPGATSNARAASPMDTTLFQRPYGDQFELFGELTT